MTTIIGESKPEDYQGFIFVDGVIWWGRILSQDDEKIVLEDIVEVKMFMQPQTKKLNMEFMFLPFAEGSVTIAKKGMALRAWHCLDAMAIKIYKNRVEHYKFNSGKTKIAPASPADLNKILDGYNLK